MTIKKLTKMKKTNLSILFLLLSYGIVNAQESALQVIPEPSIGLSTTELLVIALLVFALVLLIAAISLFSAFKQMYKEQIHPTPYQKPAKPELLDYETWLKQHKKQSGIWTKLMGLKPIEAEKDMLLPEDYDGIRELNNPTPMWFNLLFGATLVFAAGYLYYYDIADGPKQDTEYETEMAKAADDKRIFLAKFATNVDESSVKVDSKLIANGKGVFDANCVACHGDKGQGLVGPNLTDEFWLHGGNINEVFKTIKYGVPEKGMVSWEKNLTSQNIAEVANYIMSLQGTKPAGAKAPQGEKFTPAAAADLVAVK
jgi:cytochrome c oxidase cbb3-type subunit 3